MDLGSDGGTCPHCGTPLRAVEVAGFGRRMAAAMVDFAILLPTAGLLNLALLALVSVPPLTESPVGIGALLEVLAADPRALAGRVAGFFVMAAIYLVVFWGLMGRTPGGRLLRIRIIDGSASAPGVARACLRVVCLGVGLIPGALGLLWAAFDQDKRALHDHWAGTYVVRELHR